MSGWNPNAVKPKEDEIFEGRKNIKKQTATKRKNRGIEDDLMRNLKKLTVMLAIKNSEDEQQREIYQNQQSTPFPSTRNIKLSIESPAPSSRLPTIHHDNPASGTLLLQNENIIFRRIQMRKKTKNLIENDSSINEIIHVEPVRPVANRSPKSLNQRPMAGLHERVKIFTMMIILLKFNLY